MIARRIAARLVLALLIASAAVCHADTIVEDFDDGVLDPGFGTFQSPPFAQGTIALTAGRLELTAETPFTSLGVQTLFQAVGDFTTTVKAQLLTEDSGNGIGLALSDSPGHFIGLTDEGASYSVSAFGALPVSTASDTVWFRFRRTGMTLFFEADTGAGFQTLRQENGPPAPVRVGLVYSRFPQGPSGVGAFDDFVITASQFVGVPEPSHFVLVLSTVPLVLWRRAWFRQLDPPQQMGPGVGISVHLSGN